MGVQSLGPLIGSQERTVEPGIDSNIYEPLSRSWFNIINDVLSQNNFASLWTYEGLPLWDLGDESSETFSAETPVVAPRVYWAPYDWPKLHDPVKIPKVARVIINYPFHGASPGGTQRWIHQYRDETFPLIGEGITETFGDEVLFAPRIAYGGANTGFYIDGDATWLRWMGIPSGLFLEDGTLNRQVITTNVLNVAVCMRRTGSNVIDRMVFRNSVAYGSSGTSSFFDGDRAVIANAFNQFPSYKTVAFIETSLNDPIDGFGIDRTSFINSQIQSFQGTVAGLSAYNFEYGGTIGDHGNDAGSYNASLDASKILGVIRAHFEE